MIVLSRFSDPQGRPVVEIFASVSNARSAAMEAAGETIPRPVFVRALVDTGASRSVVSSWIPQSLGLEPVGVAYLQTASTGETPREHNVYSVCLFFSGITDGRLDPGLHVVEVENLVGLGVDMLLGRDVLDRCLLIYSGPEGRYTLTF